MSSSQHWILIHMPHTFVNFKDIFHYARSGEGNCLKRAVTSSASCATSKSRNPVLACTKHCSMSRGSINLNPSYSLNGRSEAALPRGKVRSCFGWQILKAIIYSRAGGLIVVNNKLQAIGKFSYTTASCLAPIHFN